MKRRELAIHWTDRWIAAVEASPSPEGPRIERTAWFELPAGSEPGPALAEALAAASFTARAALVVVPADQGLLRSFRIPSASPAERLQMVQLQLEKDLPFGIDRARLAWVPSGASVRAGVVRTEVYDRYAGLVAAAGLTVAGMTLSPLAAPVALASAPAPGAGEMRALLLSEGSRLVLVLDEPGGDVVVRSIPYGEHHLEEGVVPWSEAFAREFGRTRNAFRTRHPEAQGLRVAVVAPERELEALLAAARATGADEVAPLASPAGGAPVFAIPAGALASRAAGETAGADFVSSAARRRRIRLPAGRGRVYALAGLAALVLAAPLAVRMVYEGRVAELEERVASAKAERKRLKPSVQRAEDLSVWTHERVPWIDVQRDLSDLVDNRTVVLTSFTGRADGTVHVAGAARSEAAVLDLVGRAQKSGKYLARLGGTRSGERKAGPLAEFPIAFDLTLTPTSERRSRLLAPVEPQPSDERDLR